MRTRFSGFRILAVSPMKRTPATTIVFARMVVAEARHLERVRHRAAGLLGEVLQVRVHVVVRDEHRVEGLQALLDARDERGPFLGRDDARRLRGRDAESAVEALEADLDGGGDGHGSLR